LSFISQTEKNDHTGLIKSLPNPNVLIEYGYAYKSIGYNKIIGVMNSAFGKPTPVNMPFNLRHIEFPIQYELKPDFDSKSERKNGTLLVNQLDEKIKLITIADQDHTGTLITDILEVNSKYYILKNRNILLIIHLKVSNRNLNPTSFDINKLKLMIDDRWTLCFKSRFNGERIETLNRGSVIPRFLKDKLIRYEQDARLEAMDSKDFYFAYELNAIFHEHIRDEPIECRGEIKSLDNSYSKFEGKIEAYRG